MWYDEDTDVDEMVKSRVPKDFKVPPLPPRDQWPWFLRFADEAGRDVEDEWIEMCKFNYAFYESPSARIEKRTADLVLASLDNCTKEKTSDSKENWKKQVLSSPSYDEDFPPLQRTRRKIHQRRH